MMTGAQIRTIRVHLGIEARQCETCKWHVGMCEEPGQFPLGALPRQTCNFGSGAGADRFPMWKARDD